MKFGEFKHSVSIQTGADDADLVFRLSNGVEVEFESMTFHYPTAGPEVSHVTIQLKPKQEH